MDNLHIVNLASYNRPKITEDKRKNWVNYGDDNNYYQYLIDLYTNSTTNHSIINGVSNMIYGKGIDATDSNTKTEEYAALRSIFSNTDLKNVVLDLKLLGEGSFQIIYDNGKVIKAEHFPRQTLRAEKMNEYGKIEAYYYFYDWSKLKPNSKPERIAAFGCGNGKEPEIKIVKKYVSGYDYYCPVDYQGGLAYAELEGEVADYLINDVQNGFSGTKVVNFNNGIPDKEKQLNIKSDVMSKLTGSKGEKVIIAFNNNAESKTTIDDVPLNDAPQHYEYLSRECQNKLIVAHRVTSPLLLGIRTENNGLGSNADEIETASLLFDNITIKPYQELLIDCIDSILAVNGITLKLYFRTLQPLAFIDTEKAITDEAREEETGVKMSKEELKDFDDEQIFNELSEFGEDEDLENWELIDEQPVDYEKEEELDKEIELKNTELATQLASTGKAIPNAKSDQDEVTNELKAFRVRYQYAPLSTQANSRQFCKKMVAAAKLYRKEDIIAMGNKPVNAGWGPRGADTYNIWFYKGGGSCHHYWMRKTYMARGSFPDVKNPNAEITVNKAKKEGFKPEVNDKKVAKRPVDMPNNGFLK
tara:strand:- start:354 stop:2114 length:1761 start_codon:yes stop_codon:yes gene_type:complete